MPTIKHDDEEAEEIFGFLDDIIRPTKATENVMIIGDCNATIGDGLEEEGHGGEVQTFKWEHLMKEDKCLVDICT